MMVASASLSVRLLASILLPVLVFVGVGTTLQYRTALTAANTAYDRTLLASAKTIGEQVQLAPDQPTPVVQADFSYAALEAFEADNRSRMFYAVRGFQGEMVSGFADLPQPRPAPEGQQAYAALVHFYDDNYLGEPVRMAVLAQPVAGPQGQGMATIQVAETLELRRSLARQVLHQVLAQHALMLSLVALLVAWAVRRATQPVRRISQALAARDDTDLRPIPTADAPRELRPMLEATNGVMARLAHLLAHQKRFVRDTSHQLRTPLAVLKVQVQSARRGDVDAATALAEIETTVDGATNLANQMLALAKVEQLRQQGLPQATDWAPIVRQVALDLAPLISHNALDFELLAPAEPAHNTARIPTTVVRHHAWALRELTRNLMHNAIQHSPPGSALRVQLEPKPGPAGPRVCLHVRDCGPGLPAAVPEAVRQGRFEPFAQGSDVSDGSDRMAAPAKAAAPNPMALPPTSPSSLQGTSSGLGLAICRTICDSPPAPWTGQLSLDNRLDASGRIVGVDAVASFPQVGH